MQKNIRIVNKIVNITSIILAFFLFSIIHLIYKKSFLTGAEESMAQSYIAKSRAIFKLIYINLANSEVNKLNFTILGDYAMKKLINLTL